MTIRVKLFAVLRERAGTPELTLDLPDGASAGDAIAPLTSISPGLHGHLDRCAFALNRAYVRRDATLHDGDELALIPPVSGG